MKNIYCIKLIRYFVEKDLKLYTNLKQIKYIYLKTFIAYVVDHNAYIRTSKLFIFYLRWGNNE